MGLIVAPLLNNLDDVGQDFFLNLSRTQFLLWQNVDYNSDYVIGLI